ncbi:hypothetical protein QFZ94_000279 [Paraburkholderia sp. JPY465]
MDSRQASRRVRGGGVWPSRTTWTMLAPKPLTGCAHSEAGATNAKRRKQPAGGPLPLGAGQGVETGNPLPMPESRPLNWLRVF